MSTTNLFVELVVIGVGAATWLVLSILALFGWQWFPLSAIPAVVALVPALSCIYLLGILTDRVADAAFEGIWVKRLRAQFFADASEYHEARVLIITHSPPLAELLEYGRSRLRICRGWAFNSLLIALSLNWFIWTQLRPDTPRSRLSTAGTVIFLGVAFLCYFAWRSLAITECRKVSDQSRHLRAHIRA